MHMKNQWEHLLKEVNETLADLKPDVERLQKNGILLENIAEKMTFARLFIVTCIGAVRQEKYGRIQWGIMSLLGFLLVGTVLILGLASGSATADYELPPRDTPATGVTTTDSFGMSVGVRIHLQGQFVQSWPWDTFHWQEDLWHVVEWNDHDGNWIPVDGWQGRFDTIFPEETVMVAQRELWATNEHLGTGPFRWLVYEGENGRLMKTSEAFYLPDEAGDVVTVRVELAP